MCTLLISQSNYLPWRGFFDLIAHADRYVIYDTAQFTKNDWRNRNRIKTATGPDWLTVPVLKADLDQPINQTRIDGTHWVRKHLRALDVHYGKAPYYAHYIESLKFHLQAGEAFLSPLNERLLRWVADELCISTEFVRSEDIRHAGDPTEKLVRICQAQGATTYLSAPAARAYLDESRFRAVDIEVRWFDYGDYPDYDQQYGAFEPSLSIVDLLFNCGPKARNYMRFGAKLDD